MGKMGHKTDQVKPRRIRIIGFSTKDMARISKAAARVKDPPKKPRGQSKVKIEKRYWVNN